MFYKSPLCFTDRIIHFANNKKLHCKGISTFKLEDNKDEYVNSLLSAGPFPKYGVLGSTATCARYLLENQLLLKLICLMKL